MLNVRRASNRFPRTGYSSLKNQLSKTAESVPFTLVEGCGAQTNKDMARFVDMSIKSTKELEYQLLLAKDYGVMPRSDWKVHRGDNRYTSNALWIAPKGSWRR